MKKLLLSIGLAMITLISCSKDNIGTDLSINKKLLLTLKRNNTTYTYSYNGNKIIQYSYNNAGGFEQKWVYTYTGDLITKEDFYGNGILSISYEHTYENNKIATSIVKNYTTQSILKSKSVYTYTSDTSVMRENYYYNSNISNWTKSPSVKYTIIGGHITKEEILKADGTPNSITVYEYDNKNNVFKNILGFDKLIYKTDVSDGTKNNTVNNITKYYYSPSYGELNFTFNYDADDYPISKTWYNGNSISTETYTYQ